MPAEPGLPEQLTCALTSYSEILSTLLEPLTDCSSSYQYRVGPGLSVLIDGASHAVEGWGQATVTRTSPRNLHF